MNAKKCRIVGYVRLTCPQTMLILEELNRSPKGKTNAGCALMYKLIHWDNGIPYLEKYGFASDELALLLTLIHQKRYFP